MSRNVAILMGGYSSEFEISVKSGEVVFETLIQNKNINVYKIIIEKDNWYHVDYKGSKFPLDKKKFEIIKKNEIVKFDIVFNTIHGEPGENGEIQEYLERLNIKQTSSRSKEAKLTFNKTRCKNEVSKFGILTPKSLVIKKGQIDKDDLIINNLNFPLFIKPNEGGSSFGISRITKRDDIIKSLKKCYKENSDALIEEEIQGREISVGVIFYNNEVTALPPTEIISHNEFFDYNAKYKGQSDEITPAELDESKIKEVKSLAIKIYQKLNLRGFTRSDFILKNNKFYFLEVNTNPGLTKESILPQQAKAAGININKLFESVLK